MLNNKDTKLIMKSKKILLILLVQLVLVFAFVPLASVQAQTLYERWLDNMDACQQNQGYSYCLSIYGDSPPVTFSSNGDGTVEGIIDSVMGWINQLIPIAVTLAILFFLWGVIKFLASGGDTNKKEEVKKTMMWGVIALFVLVSVWGLVAFLRSTFGVSNPDAGNLVVPTIDDLTP